jgi:hypothetical protein
MTDIKSISLDALPSDESDDLEYKSSLIGETELKREIQNAASAFWNSGGGMFLAGVSNKGTVDGGIPCAFGRQSLKDWLAQVVSHVTPQASYAPRIFAAGTHPNINADKCVLAIQFSASSAIPHQSADKKYYIRAGPHTVPAPHFLIEALYAKRYFRRPKLVHLARVEHFAADIDFLHMDVVAATDAVALDVEIDLFPSPTKRGLDFPLAVPVIDRLHPFGFRFEIPVKPPFVSDLTLKYRDLEGNAYSEEAVVDASKCLTPWHRNRGELGAVTEQIRELTRAVERMRDGFRLG